MPLSISTSWNGARHARPTDVVREVKSLGFEWVELYAHWLPSQLQELKQALAAAGVRISSLHAPCPSPADGTGQAIPLGDWLAEVDEQLRLLALDAHRGTIDAAAELGATGVVVHLGNSGAKSLQGDIFQAIRDHGAGSPQHRALVEQARQERQKAAASGTLEAAVRSARELGEHARGTSVELGLECRDGFVEIPSIDEYPTIFEACQGLPVRYWHDMGHGSKLENAGFVCAEDYLARFGSRLLGVHLHDTRLDVDHQAPGTGDTDFGILGPYLRPTTIRTLELSPRVELDRIRPAVAYLRTCGVV